MLRLTALALASAFALSATPAVTPAMAATAKQKAETCKFGADDQKLTGAARKAFMTKCMSSKDDPRGTPEKKN